MVIKKGSWFCIHISRLGLKSSESWGTDFGWPNKNYEVILYTQLGWLLLLLGHFFGDALFQLSYLYKGIAAESFLFDRVRIRISRESNSVDEFYKRLWGSSNNTDFIVQYRESVCQLCFKDFSCINEPSPSPRWTAISLPLMKTLKHRVKPPRVTRQAGNGAGIWTHTVGFWGPCS